MACKVITCCDLDDFPQTSSSSGNCPVSYYWNEVRLSCLRIPANAILAVDGQPILGIDGEPILAVQGQPILGVDGEPILGVDGQPILAI